ncbi:MAG: hypothetical protein H6739_37605 [Alphaproteobacteria bacterium]|nr:hypothetical protein [Alphaproteobacteria bacterium]
MTLLALLLGCAPGPLMDTGALPEAPSYAHDVQPILEARCVRCHQRGRPMLAGVELDSYEAAHATRVSSVCTAISPDLVERFGDHLLPLAGSQDMGPCEGFRVLSMPPGASDPLPYDEQLLLARWVAAGAME